MTRQSTHDDLDIPRAGKLDESAEVQAVRAMLRSPRGRWIRIAARKGVIARGRTLASTASTGYRATPIGAAAVTGIASTFHFHMSSTSRRPPPISIQIVQRVFLWPARADVRHIKALAAAKYHRGAKTWSLPAGHGFLKTPRGQALSSRTAQAVAAMKRDFDGKKQALLRSLRHQRYVERSGGFSKRATEIESDKAGRIVVGNIGATPAARRHFWIAANEVEQRRDARVQDRIVVELPYWVSAAARRTVLEEFGKEFSKRKLGWLAVAHLPDAHGDVRNFHAHYVVSTRPILRFPKSGEELQDEDFPWMFAEKKDRSTQGSEWVRHLRQKYAEIVNQVTAEYARQTGIPIERIFYPGRNIEIGVTSPPTVHLGPARSAIIRRGAGVPPKPKAIDVFVALESCIRTLTRDKAELEVIKQRKDRLFAQEPLTDYTIDARAEVVVATGNAVESVAECEAFLRKVLEDISPSGEAPDSSSQNFDLFELTHITRRFDQAALLIAKSRTAISNLEDLQKQRPENPELENGTPGRRTVGITTHPYDIHNDDPEKTRDEPIRRKVLTIPAVDPDWVFDEIRRRLDRPWIPARIENGKSLPVFEQAGSVAHIRIGDAINFEIRFSKDKSLIFRDHGPEEDEHIRHTAKRAIWQQTIKEVLDVTTLRIGEIRLLKILESRGIQVPDIQTRAIIKIQRPTGTLTISKDGRYAAMDGQDANLKAVFEDIQKARADIMAKTGGLKVLAARRNPFPESADHRELPSSFQTFVRGLTAAPVPIKWQFMPSDDRLHDHLKSVPNVHQPSSRVDTAVPSTSGSKTIGRAIAGVQGALTAVGAIWRSLSEQSSRVKPNETVTDNSRISPEHSRSTVAGNTTRLPQKPSVSKPATASNHVPSPPSDIEDVIRALQRRPPREDRER